jgi:hypothetical protein
LRVRLVHGYLDVRIPKRVQSVSHAGARQWNRNYGIDPSTACARPNREENGRTARGHPLSILLQAMDGWMDEMLVPCCGSTQALPTRAHRLRGHRYPKVQGSTRLVPRRFGPPSPDQVHALIQTTAAGKERGRERKSIATGLVIILRSNVSTIWGSR